MITEKQKIWFCGFYEGEGWISNDKYNNRIRIGIAQNDKTPLDLGQQLWGGFIKKRIRKSPASDKICIGYEWILNTNIAMKFIDDIQEFMIIPYKINQLNNALIKQKVGLNLKFKCDFCEKEYANISGKSRHQKRNHTYIDKSFNCHFCDKTYKSKDTYKTKT